MEISNRDRHDLGWLEATAMLSSSEAAADEKSLCRVDAMAAEARADRRVRFLGNENPLV